MMQWYNEPPSWAAEGDTITVTAGPKTDFWRVTHDNGVRDSGHFYFQPVTGDFTAEVKVTGQYTALYDQAGLMVRLDAANWMKCGVEFFEGMQHASVVITRDCSDWSVVPLPHNPPTLWLRVMRHGHTLEVHYSTDGAAYTMLRQGYLTRAAQVEVGLMCAAPTGDGFRSRFEGFTVRQA